MDRKEGELSARGGSGEARGGSSCGVGVGGCSRKLMGKMGHTQSMDKQSSFSPHSNVIK